MKRPDTSWSQEAVLRYWIKERHKIHLLKTAGTEPPWTDDPALRAFRFCNISRRFDKMTMRLRADCKSTTAVDRLMTIVAYRMFNRLEIWNAVEPAMDPWNENKFRAIIKDIASDGTAVTSGVWMVGGTKGKACWETNIEAPIFAWKYRNMLVDVIGRSLEQAYNAFLSLPWVGPFVANEMAMDALYEAGLVRSGDMSWVRLGPGATRGIRRLVGKPDPGWQPPKAVEDDYDTLRGLFISLVVQRPVLPDVKLTIHDVEHCLCEYDKYCRASFEGARLKNIYRGG